MPNAKDIQLIISNQNMYNFKRKHKKLHMKKNRAKILRNTIYNFKSKHVIFQAKKSSKNVQIKCVYVYVYVYVYL